jgi:high-affinity Fe2+/Pb2+ permease
LLKPGSSTSILLKERGTVMTMIQIAAAVLAVILVIVLIVRRRARNK